MVDDEAGYTFVSISTAKPGRLDELCLLARGPSERMEGKVPGMLARQVSVDRERNTVVVWVTFDRKESLYDFLASEEGRRDHGEGEDMSCIETFTMYDLVPVSQRL
ncbi:MAG: hypothetical protein KC621_11600 [Myxococcales bacterium]|nr:hypothetical protein [Myxococcales bacterium]